MLKDTLILCAELINRDDICDALINANAVEDIENNQVRNDVTRLIHFYNFSLNAACENYLNLVSTEFIKSDSNGKIHYYNFDYEAVRILEVLDECGKRVMFTTKLNYLLVNSPNKLYSVSYKYLPATIKNLTDKTNMPKCLPEKTLVYAIVSEFLASKSQFNQSDYFRDKFLTEMFKIKSKKERQLKSTFIR